MKIRQLKDVSLDDKEIREAIIYATMYGMSIVVYAGKMQIELMMSPEEAQFMLTALDIQSRIQNVE